MPRKPKTYWRIEIEKRHQVVFRRRLPGNLTKARLELSSNGSRAVN
jgi:hypothetical protein